MSKAEMHCTGCGHEWTYSGLHAFSCYCPRCGTENHIPENTTEIIRLFGFGEPDRSTSLGNVPNDKLPDGYLKRRGLK